LEVSDAVTYDNTSSFLNNLSTNIAIKLDIVVPQYGINPKINPIIEDLIIVVLCFRNRDILLSSLNGDITLKFKFCLFRNRIILGIACRPIITGNIGIPE
jgi:hypothetical protein